MKVPFLCNKGYNGIKSSRSHFICFAGLGKMFWKICKRFYVTSDAIS